jgi:hypothetical protein
MSNKNKTAGMGLGHRTAVAGLTNFDYSAIALLIDPASGITLNGGLLATSEATIGHESVIQTMLKPASTICRATSSICGQ